MGSVYLQLYAYIAVLKQNWLCKVTDKLDSGSRLMTQGKAVTYLLNQTKEAELIRIAGCSVGSD